MAHLTPRENLLRVMNGEIPEWVPSYSYYGPLPGVDETPANQSIRPSFLTGTRGPDGGVDAWGVPFEAVDAVGGFSLPKPGHFILKDPTKWRDVIKAPDISGFDWDQVVKKDLEKLTYDRKECAVFLSGGGGYFQHLMGFMGFTEGLAMLHVETDSIKELITYMADFYVKVLSEYIDRVKPDVLSLGDDTAAERAPFMSPEMYREAFVPYYDMLAKFGRDRGIPINFHNCGKCESFLYDLVRIGVTSWEPVQLSNDIKAIQKRYGNHLVIGGGWEGRGRLTAPDVTDEEIRESVRVSIDSFAKDGGYMFAAAYTPGSRDDARTKHWNEVLQREVYDYGHKFYK